MPLLNLLTEKQRIAIQAVRQHTEQLLDVSPRFRFFTLHGGIHTENLFKILKILVDGGIKLTTEELYLLSLAICIHDVGMVASLSKLDIKNLLAGNSAAPDPAIVEEYIRDSHQNLIENYIHSHFDFLASLGVTVADAAIAIEIARCHRKENLSQKKGVIKKLGALIRIIDELDIGPERAPISSFINNKSEMDATTCWHWYKHNIVRFWQTEDNVIFKNIHGKKNIEFQITVFPRTIESIPYWLHQIQRPIQRVLQDHGCAQIIKDFFDVSVECTVSQGYSKSTDFGKDWAEIEELALSGGRKVVLLVDDEFRKMVDLMLRVSMRYHIAYASNASDAFDKLAAGRVDLAIVDMQIGGVGLWTPCETNDYKTTGLNIIKKINADYPDVKIGVLSATRYSLDLSAEKYLVFNLKKPTTTAILETEVARVLQ